MGDTTAIEWADATWNPITGCTKVSPGCDNCYAERVTNRWRPGTFDTVRLHPERLDKPLRWRKPRRVFVNSMSDLFHDDVPDAFIALVFGVMAVAHEHTFQVLTKRHARMRSLLSSKPFYDAVMRSWEHNVTCPADVHEPEWPIENVWLGVSVEDQKWADIRIPALLDTPAAVRFLSCEPLLGPVSLRGSWCDYLEGWRTEAEHHPYCNGSCDLCPVPVQVQTASVDWVIVGGESGAGFRAPDPAWVRQIRDDCAASSTALLFKQWGGITPKAGGRELDGRTWDEYPATREPVPA